MNDQDFKTKFLAHKIDVPDDGFSEHIIRQIPEHKSLLPQIIMIVSVTVSLVLLFVLQSFVPIIEQIHLLVTSICRMQMPSLSAIVSYMGILTMTGTIGYTVVQVSGE